MEDDLGHKLTTSESELITSLTSGGALVGALIAGLLTDRFGRKLGMYIGCALFFTGSIIWSSSFSVPQMSLARFIVGLGVGSAAMIIVSLISRRISWCLWNNAYFGVSAALYW